MPKFKFEIILIIAISFFYISSLKSGHSWMGDSSMYIMHAANISKGKIYAETGYIFNPENPYIGPKSYPPLYPILLSPIYKSFGLNFKAMKIENIFFFSGFLYVLFLFFRLKFNSTYALIALLIIGLNPRFWAFKEMVYPDFLFCFFTYLFFFLYEKSFSKDGILFVVLSGLCAWAAYATRAPGALLPVAAFIYEFFGKKDFRRFSVFAIVFMIPFFLQGFLLGVSNEYPIQFLVSLKNQPQAFFYVIKLFLKSFSDFWSFWPANQPLLTMLSSGVFAFSFILSCAGFFISAKKRVSVLDYFGFLYLFLIAVMGIYDGTRYFLPIAPLILFYIFRALESLNDEKIKKNISRIFVFSTLSLFLIFYIGYADFGKIKSGFFSKETQKMFSYLKTNTLKTDTIIFRKPRVLALFTDRKSSVYSDVGGDEHLLEYFKKIGADYCVAGRVFRNDRKFFYPFVLRHKNIFKEVYVNVDFKVFKIIKKN